MPIADVAARAAGADAILTCPGDNFDAALIADAAVKREGHSHIQRRLSITSTSQRGSARGIAVCNTPDVLSVATAETALLLILAAARRAGEGERLIRSGRWRGWAPTQLLGCGRRRPAAGHIRHGPDRARAGANWRAASA